MKRPGFYVVLDDDETYSGDGYIVLRDSLTEQQIAEVQAGEKVFKTQGIPFITIDQMIALLEDAGLWDRVVEELMEGTGGEVEVEAKVSEKKIDPEILGAERSQWEEFFKEFPEISTKVDSGTLEIYFNRSVRGEPLDIPERAFRIDILDFLGTTKETTWYFRIAMELQARREAHEAWKRYEG